MTKIRVLSIFLLLGTATVASAADYGVVSAMGNKIMLKNYSSTTASYFGNQSYNYQANPSDAAMAAGFSALIVGLANKGVKAEAPDWGVEPKGSDSIETKSMGSE